MNKQKLAAKIWESANQMRSKIEANEYKDYILGFIFYKYLSDTLEQFAKAQDFSEDDIRALSEDDPETVEFIKRNLGYFIAHQHLFSTWIEQGSDFGVAEVRDALSAFNRLIHPNHKLLFDGIFKTLETGLSKLGDTAAKQTKAISELIQLIKVIPMDGRQGYDVLGFIYEYLISMFAANAGKKAGEFYTPHEVSVLMSEIIAAHVKGKEKIDIYDSTSGSGSLLLNIGKAIAKHMGNQGTIKYYAQELKENTYNLTRMNLVMRGILPANIETRNGDTLEDDWPFFDDNDPVNTYNPLYLDAVVSNPPYSQKWDPEHKDSDPRYARFGLAPKSKADYAFLLHDLYHLKPDGIMAIVLPHGVLFRGGEEGQIRKNLIENDHLDTIIGLPANIFFGTGIPTIILVLRQKRNNSDVLIVDASKGFAKEGKNNKLRACDIKKISDTVIGRLNLPRYSRVVAKGEICANGYNLNIPRYVDSSEAAESWDLYASMFGGIPQSELAALEAYWQALPGLRDALFSDEPYATPKVADLAHAIHNHPEVQNFAANFATAFADFPDYLKTELIAHMATLNVPRQESLIGEAIFRRLQTLPLIDKYQAYQMLDDHWQAIAVDLEILQTEGFNAARVVEPNLVMKKKNGKDAEVQEGWKGRVLPFELVQATYLTEELAALRDKENRLSEISASLEETLENFSEEEKESAIAQEVVNESGDKFITASVSKEAKQLSAEAKQSGGFAADSVEAKLIQAADWLAQEKTLKTVLKQDSDALHLLTKTTLEGLSDAQVHELLQGKWITPLNDALHRLPDQQIDSLTSQLQALVEKYQITYADTAREIQHTEGELAAMLDELDGNAFDLQGLAELKNLLLHQHSNDKLVTLKQAMLQKMFPQDGTIVPEIRFKGFGGEWEERRLEEICVIVGGGTPSTSIREYWGGNIDWYSPTEIGSEVYANGSVKKITQLGLEKCSSKMLPANKTILFTSRAGIGDMAILKRAGCTNQGFQSLVLHDDIDTYFIYSMGYLLKNYALKYASGSTFLEISSKQLGKMVILLPKDKEQQKIGTYFRKLDALIAQHATQLQKLKQIKSACLAKMFV